MPQPTTLFAPVNSAFAAVGLNATTAVMNVNATNQTLAVLQYHLLGSAVFSSNIGALQFPHTWLSLPLLAGAGQVIDLTKGALSISLNWGLAGNALYAATVLIADVVSSNGVIHKIDKVLQLPASPVNVALESGLTQLLTAAAQLEAAVGPEGNIAVAVELTGFAPTNAAWLAFGGVPSDTTALFSVLGLHVITDIPPIYSTYLINGTKLLTQTGAELTILADGLGDIWVQGPYNSAKITSRDSLTWNGVFHEIDTVLHATPSGSSGTSGSGSTGSSSTGHTSGSSSQFGSIFLTVVLAASLVFVR